MAKTKRKSKAKAGAKAGRKSKAARASGRRKTFEKLSDATDADYNPRSITEEALRGLGNSLRCFGDLSGIVVNARTGNMVCGHQRRKHLSTESRIAWGEFSRVEYGPPGRRFKSRERGGWLLSDDGQRFEVREVEWPEWFEKLANVAANNTAVQGKFTPAATDIIEELAKDQPDAVNDLLLQGLQASQGAAGGAAGGKSGEKPELEISPELHERSDFVLVVIDNEIDWNAIAQALDLKTVTAVPNGTADKPGSDKMKQKGLGRVITSGQLMESIRRIREGEL